MRKWEKENIEEAIIDYFDGVLSIEEQESLQSFLNDHPELPQLEDFDGAPNLDGALDAQIPEFDLTVQPDVIEPDQIDLLFAKQLEGDTSKDENRFIDQLRADNTVVEKQHALFQHLKVEGDQRSHGFVLPKSDLGIDPKDQLAIAYSEGDLSPLEMKSFEGLRLADASLDSAAKTFDGLRLVADESVVFTEKESLRQGAKVVSLRQRVLRYAAVAAAILVLVSVGWLSQTSSSNGSGVVAVDSNPANRLVQPVANFSDDVGQTESEVEVVPFILKEEIRTVPQSDTHMAHHTASLMDKSVERQQSPTAMKSLSTAFIPEENAAVANLIQPSYPDMVLPDAPFMDDEVAMADNTIDLSSPKAAAKTLKDKSKDLVYGDEEYGDDAFLLVLTEKAVESIGGEADLIASANETNSSGWKVRLGKLSVSRY